MTVKQCIKKNGINYETDTGRWLAVDIDFINKDGEEDETQFDVMEANMETDLSMLYADFCKEEGIGRNTVTSITVVASADTQEELEEMTR